MATIVIADLAYSKELTPKKQSTIRGGQGYYRYQNSRTKAKAKANADANALALSGILKIVPGPGTKLSSYSTALTSIGESSSSTASAIG